MKLIAETAAGDRVPLEADPDESINVLKAQIHDKTGDHIEENTLLETMCGNHTSPAVTCTFCLF